MFNNQLNLQDNLMLKINFELFPNQKTITNLTKLSTPNI